MTIPFELTATDAIKLIRENKLSRCEWVQSCFERIREKEDLVKAWVYLDEDRALEKAKQLDNKNDKSQIQLFSKIDSATDFIVDDGLEVELVVNVEESSSI